MNDGITTFDPYEYGRIANNSKEILMNILSYVSVVV